MTITNFHSELFLVWVSDGASVNFVNSTVVGNRVLRSSYANDGVFSVNAWDEDYDEQDTSLRLEDCVVRNNVADNDFVTAANGTSMLYDTLIYSDIVREVYDTESESMEPSLPLSAAPANGTFISRSTPWLIEVQTVRLFQGCRNCNAVTPSYASLKALVGLLLHSTCVT